MCIFYQVNQAGHTPLSLACHENTHQAIRLLIQLCPGLVNHPRNASSVSRSPLNLLVQKQNTDCLKLLNAAGYRYSRQEIDLALEGNGRRLSHSISSWIEKEVLQPWTLEKICRTCIRDRLPERLVRKVHKLPIPQKVADSVLLRRIGH